MDTKYLDTELAMLKNILHGSGRAAVAFPGSADSSEWHSAAQSVCEPGLCTHGSPAHIKTAPKGAAEGVYNGSALKTSTPWDR